MEQLIIPLKDKLLADQVKAAVKHEPDPMTKTIQQLVCALNDHTGELNRLNSAMYSLQSSVENLKNMNFTIKSGY